jgi:hypothetical protein
MSLLLFMVGSGGIRISINYLVLKKTKLYK